MCEQKEKEQKKSNEKVFSFLVDPMDVSRRVALILSLAFQSPFTAPALSLRLLAGFRRAVLPSAES